MQITEIYRSLQGESTHAGLPCVFVRLTGCNLRCSWCDSEYAFYGGRKMTVEEVLEEVEHRSPGGLKHPSSRLTNAGPLLGRRFPYEAPLSQESDTRRFDTPQGPLYLWPSLACHRSMRQEVSSWRCGKISRAVNPAVQNPR